MIRFLLTLVATGASLFFVSPVARAEVNQVPPGGREMLAPGGFAYEGDASTYAAKTGGTADVPVWSLATLQPGLPLWAIQLRIPTNQAVTKGDTALLRFRGRVTETRHETGQGQIRVVVQRTAGRTQRAANARFDLTAEWTEFFVPVRFAADHGAGEAGVFFAFGFPPQTMELTDVSLLHYGTAVDVAALPRTRVTYAGARADAPWRREADARIERIRKGDLAVFVTDADGLPLPGVTVSVEMTRHHFEFGTAVRLPLLMREGPDREPYRRAVFSLFNAVGPENDLKWPFWTGTRSDYGENRALTLEALRWLQEQEIPVRGHVFIWPAAHRLPKEVSALIGTERQGEIPGAINEHIREISAATAGLITEWDVLNEPYSHHQLMDLFGREIMADWFKTARAALGPDVPLYFNDWGNHDLPGDPRHLAHFIDTARFILARGGPIDGLGLQAHIGGVPTAPETLLATLDHYERELGLPIRVTEFDFTTDDPQLHADYTRDFLIAYFSHPLTAGIQFWGIWENAHWQPKAALFDAEWNETPAGTATRQLLRETWWTRAAGATDQAGRYDARGFYGRYTVRATLGDQVVETVVNHRPGALPTAIRLVLP